MKDLLTIGNSVIDEFMEIDEASVHCDINHDNCIISFNYADKIPVKSFRQVVAGNAVNVAIGCKTLGMATEIYTEVGNDANGTLILETLKNQGIGVEHSRQTDVATDVHPIVVFQGERTIFSYHSERIYEMPEMQLPKFIYYTSLGKGFESFQEKLEHELSKEENTIVAMNPGSGQLRTGLEAIRRFLKYTDVLFVNKEEAQKLTDNGNDIEGLHKKLAEMGTKLSVITDSTNGSSAYDGSEMVQIGIFDENSEVVDKTGAGDSFASGVLGAMFYGKNIEEALKWGAINSASVVTQIGANKGLCTKEEIETKLNQNLFTKPNL